MPHISNPFLDFKYGDFYASDFHLIRVSDGSRYNDNFLPTLTDKTTEIPGGDGMYWFNTYYKQRQISVNVAFDSVTETDLRGIRNWLNGKQVQPLIFDEHDDRQYFAKVTGSPQLKYVAFDEPINPRLSNNIDSPYSARFQLKSTIPIATQPDDGFYAVKGVIEGQAFEFINIVYNMTSNCLICEFDDVHITPLITRTWSYGSTIATLQENNVNIVLTQSYDEAFINSFMTSLDLPTTQVIYKGEGTIQFTCFDPYSYDINATSQEYDKDNNIYTPSVVSVGGECPTPFTVVCEDTLSANTTITVTDDISTYFIVLANNETGSVIWDSSTGMVSNGQGQPISFTGNSMGTLTPGTAPVLTTTSTTGTFTFSFYNKYL